MTTPTPARPSPISAGHAERLSELHTLREDVGTVLARHLDRLTIAVEQSAVAAGHRPPRAGQVMVFLEVRSDPYALERHPEDCLACREGHHGACTGVRHDIEADEFVACGCAEGGHA